VASVRPSGLTRHRASRSAGAGLCVFEGAIDGVWCYATRCEKLKTWNS
jgi:hypothetical protein